MRTTIACQRCRTSKVKCKHTGAPPCTGCLKTGNVETCILSGPVLKRKADDAPVARGTKRRARTRTPIEVSIEPSPVPLRPQCEDRSVRDAFSHISRDDLAKAVITFQAQFPEFGFLHPSDLDLDHGGDLGELQMLRLMALCAVSSRYTQILPLRAIDPSFITQELHKRIVTSPSVTLIQAFLIMSLHSWGEGEGFSAWMSVGIASRMAQGLLNVHTATARKRSLSEVEKRTLWTCFAMDKLLSCGKRRPVMLSLEAMGIPLPSKHTAFIYGEASGNEPVDGQVLYPPHTQHGMDDYFAIIVRGLDIWSKIHTWTVEGGRKQPGMAEPEQCPWQVTSQWSLMKQELQHWRDLQQPQLRYPETKASVHVHLRQAEKFGYINLIYYVSLMFLCREFIPFLPVNETHPRGPIDPPLLKAIAPESFWVQNLQELFHAATQISNLLRDLRTAACPLQTPFTGLCAFTSALLSFYAAAFPAFMGFDRLETEQAERQAQETMADLEGIGEIWKIAREWADVLNTANSLFTRVASTPHGRVVRRSRYDYPELEDSMNFAPSKGMPQNEPGDSGLDPSAEAARQGQLDPDQGPQHVDEHENTSTLNLSLPAGEFMDDDEWRLWSFWDDPHLLSTFTEYEGL